MVCLGNICRSPMAEAILIKKLEREMHYPVEVDSAEQRTITLVVKRDHRTIESGKKHGVDLSSHRGRQFSRRDFDDFDLIYAMDNENYSNIVYLPVAKNNQKKYI